MGTELSTDFGDLIAQRIRDGHREIAERWLQRLEAILPVGATEIFPSNDVLDHIPALIREIADHVGAGHGDVLAANTAVLSKARELGELRFAQKASVYPAAARVPHPRRRPRRVRPGAVHAARARLGAGRRRGRDESPERGRLRPPADHGRYLRRPLHGDD